MNKINLILIWILMLAITCAGALALEEVAQYGMTDQHQWVVSGTMGTAPYLVNWTDLGQDDNMPLVYDINNDSVNEIIQSRAGTIKVYNLNGSVLASTSISGLGSRQISVFDADHCSVGYGIYAVLNDGSLELVCFVNNTLLIPTWNSSAILPNMTTPDFTGASVMKVNGDNIAVYYASNSTTHFAVFANETHLTRTQFDLGTTLSQTFVGTPPHGNLKNDGYEYWVFPYFSSTQAGVTYVNRLGAVTTITPANFTSGNYQEVERVPLVVKRGGGTADELLIPYRNLSTGYKDRMWYGDANGYTYSDFGTIYDTNGDTHYSNAVQLGTNGDICFAGTFAAGSARFFCRTPATLLWTYNSTLDSSGTSATYYQRLTATDMNNDGFSDFFFGSFRNSTGSVRASLCLYTNHSNPLSCSMLGDQASYIYGVDIGGDGYRDIVYSDQSNNLLRVFRTGGITNPCFNVTCGDTCTSNTTLLTNGSCLVNGTGYICLYDPFSCPNSCGGNACIGNFCNDTDLAGYPSINYTMQGVMTATGISPRTDYCNINYVLEYYCDNSTSYHPVPVSFDCTTIGDICVNGSCTASGMNGTCDDSDILTYPTINYNISGTAVTDNGTNTSSYTDFCYGGNNLLEYYCGNPATPLVTNASYYCPTAGKICVDGACVLNQTNQTNISNNCSNYSDSYTYPIVWLETFGYSGSILGHGWIGYPYMVGNYGQCNALFMDANLTLSPIAHVFANDISTDFVFSWDMMLQSSIGNNSQILNGMPEKVYLLDSSGDELNPLVYLEWGTDGIIYNHQPDAPFDVPIGNWQGSSDSYKLIVNMTTHKFKFYFTNSTNFLSYNLGCDNCTFRNNGSVRQFEVAPQTPVAYTYQQVGTWLDNLQLVIGAEQVPVQNITNFCYFAGCIFHDHFNYTDDTYTHGWYQFNTTPSNSIVFYGNSTQGYSFDHIFDTFSNTDGTGEMSIQFEAMFPQPPETALDLMNFQLYAPDLLTKPIDIEFGNGIITDVNRGVNLGSYSYGSWNKYTLLVNLADNTYDLYQDTNQLVSGAPITHVSTQVDKVGFWVNTNSSMYIDYITLANGTALVDSLSTGGIINADTGVPLSDLKWCWSTTNGSFNWNCCTSDENKTKTILCPLRVTGRFWLGSATTFVLNNFIYFLILIILFVLITPYIVPALRGQPKQ